MLVFFFCQCLEKFGAYILFLEFKLMLKSCAIFLKVVLKPSTMKILTMKLLIKVVTSLVENPNHSTSYYVGGRNNVAFAKTGGTKEKIPKEM
jgi:hypothetical protein